MAKKFEIDTIEFDPSEGRTLSILFKNGELWEKEVEQNEYRNKGAGGQGGDSENTGVEFKVTFNAEELKIVEAIKKSKTDRLKKASKKARGSIRAVLGKKLEKGTIKVVNEDQRELRKNERQAARQLIEEIRKIFFQYSERSKKPPKKDSKQGERMAAANKNRLKDKSKTGEKKRGRDKFSSRNLKAQYGRAA